MVAPLSHSTAVRFWQVYGSCFNSNLSILPPSTSSMSVGLTPPTSEVISRAKSLNLFTDEEPLHYLVTDQKARRKMKGIVTHSCNNPLAASSVMFLDERLCVCSPELTSLQMARTLSLAELACLGTTLCGIYTKGLQGLNSTEGRRSVRQLPKRKQLTTISRLTDFVEQMSGFKGAKKARASLRLVVERSRSPMETLTALLLSAPFRYGGFSLPKPILNLRVDLPSWLHGGAGDQGMNRWGEFPFAECDMAFFYDKRCVYVDFHGEWSHAGEANIHHDSLRANVFNQLNMAYYSLTKDQVLSFPLLEKIALQLRSELGLRERTAISNLPRRQRQLHAQLVRVLREGKLV